MGKKVLFIAINVGFKKVYVDLTVFDFYLLEFIMVCLSNKVLQQDVGPSGHALPSASMGGISLFKE